MHLVAQAALLVSFPVAAAVLGAVVASFWRPPASVISGVQHFAAGVVLSALVGEIMPALQEQGHLPFTVLGFVAGAGLVLGIGAYGRHTEEEAAESAGREAAHRAAAREAAHRAVGVRGARLAQAAVALPVGMLAAMAIDLLLDGVLIGVGVRLGERQGLILAIALTLEILFLGLSVTAELGERGAGRGRAIAVSTGLGLMTAVGAVGGAALLGGVSADVMAAVLAFGAAALLYLVVEELLVEAHEEKETVTLGAMFFLGFLTIYVLASLG